MATKLCNPIGAYSNCLVFCEPHAGGPTAGPNETESQAIPPIMLNAGLNCGSVKACQAPIGRGILFTP